MYVHKLCENLKLPMAVCTQNIHIYICTYRIYFFSYIKHSFSIYPIISEGYYKRTNNFVFITQNRSSQLMNYNKFPFII